MKINYNVKGPERKALVSAISHELNAPTKYLGAPTFAYEVDGYHIDKEGTVTGSDNRDLVADLQGLHNFKPVSEEYDETAEGWDDAAWHDTCDREDRDEDGNWDGNETPYYREPRYTEEEFGLGVKRIDPVGENGMQASDVPKSDDTESWAEREMRRMKLESKNVPDYSNRGEYGGDYDIPQPFELVIEMPRSKFSDSAIANLKRLVESKSTLFKKAFGTQTLPIDITEEKISFPWFNPQGDAAAVRAYTHFVAALCEMAKTQKRINAVDKPMDNEKYAFRCFLLRLGFIGSEYKSERKILLSKLSGSSAFKNPAAGGADDE